MPSPEQYRVITDEIIAALREGVAPWQKGWSAPSWASQHHNGATGHAYRGLNPFTLEMKATRKGYESTAWLSFKQVKQLGGFVLKGQKGTLVYFWKFETRERENRDTGEIEEVRIPFMKMHSVFNLDQTSGVTLPKREHERQQAATERLRSWEPITEAQTLLDGYIGRGGPTLSHRGDQACYIPSQDAIVMPPREAFSRTEEYYSVVYHEAGHSTGHGSRLRRFDPRTIAPFGSGTYSKEELVAEFTSAFLAHHVGISSTRDNSVSYIKSWLRFLESDPKVILHAATKAQAAADHIIGGKHD